MINLMYVVLMAMLALNVSSDVLHGFSLIDDGLKTSAQNATMQNATFYEELEAAHEKNPEKAGEWYAKAQTVRAMSDSLYNFAEELKEKIVKFADGSEGDVNNINAKDNTEATTHIMLAPGVGRGQELYNAINSYRTKILTMITDSVQRRIIGSSLSTDVPDKGKLENKDWKAYMFENTPVAASVALLSKLQNDVRYAEGEILHSLIANIDVKDVRVNQIGAYVVPNSQTIVRGGTFEARIIMAAVDTTQRPDIYIGNTLLNSPNGIYRTVCSKEGSFTLKGYMTMENGDGEIIRREFSQPYTVIEPSATVSATMMNMLYAGYENPISVGVPGVPTSKISATMTGGTLRQTKPGEYIAVPTAVGQEAVITVVAETEGRKQEMGKFAFNVRKLPDPTPYINVIGADGSSNRYKGGKGLAKQAIMAASGINAAIDDGLLDIPFRVIGFSITFIGNRGEALVEQSGSASFTEAQKNQIRQLTRNKRFYISQIKAVGPDGIERTLPSAMEVIVN